MGNYIFWTFMLAVLAVLSVGIAVFVRAYANGTTASALFFRPRSDRRLEVVEHANIDGRRKLLLIRRDDVEHLLMTGGPVDVVVETGIPSASKPAEAIDTASNRLHRVGRHYSEEAKSPPIAIPARASFKVRSSARRFCVAEVGHRELPKIEWPYRAGERANRLFGLDSAARGNFRGQ